MYSRAWFDTFASAIPQEVTAMEADAIARFAPPARHPRLLDLGCGVGRLAAPLLERGYQVTGIDVSLPALERARGHAPAATLLALDQRYVGAMRWEFDTAVSVWNSFGFTDRQADAETLQGLRHVLSDRGTLLLDLFHPAWLARNERRKHRDPRGATIDRWVTDGRCHHEIRYPDGSVDDIQFNVYTPDEIMPLLRDAGFEVERACAWWNEAIEPGPDHARYQLVCARRN